MRVSDRKINPHLGRELSQTLYKTIVDVKSLPEAKSFLDAFLSPTEQEALAKRMGVAYWLSQGRGYSNIRENLKVSSATIASVQDALKKNKSLVLFVEKIKAEEWAGTWAKKIKGLLGR